MTVVLAVELFKLEFHSLLASLKLNFTHQSGEEKNASPRSVRESGEEISQQAGVGSACWG